VRSRPPQCETIFAQHGDCPQRGLSPAVREFGGQSRSGTVPAVGLGCVNAAATTLGEVLTRATDFLAAGGCETPRLDAELLLARALEL
jgi:hypothetical protein